MLYSIPIVLLSEIDSRGPRESRKIVTSNTDTHTDPDIHTLLISAGACSRWNEVSRRIELWISIKELNEQGEYSSVELHSGKDISTGGVFQLRQVREKLLESFPLGQSGCF